MIAKQKRLLLNLCNATDIFLMLIRFILKCIVNVSNCCVLLESIFLLFPVIFFLYVDLMGNGGEEEAPGEGRPIRKQGE